MLPTHLRASASRIPRLSRKARVGSVTSTAEAINKLNAYVGEISSRHDLSTASWKEVWVANVPSAPDGSLGKADKGIIADLLNRLDACAAVHGCEWSADAMFSAMNRELGLSSDNGLMSFGQLMQLLGRYPTNPDDPSSVVLKPSDVPGVPDPEVISDEDRSAAAWSDSDITGLCMAKIGGPIGLATSGPSVFADCIKDFSQRRDEAKAKIARITSTPTGPFFERRATPSNPLGNIMVSPVIAPPKPKLTTTEKVAVGVGVPAVVGGLAALKWGVLGLAVGGTLGLAAVGAGAYYLTRKK